MGDRRTPNSLARIAVGSGVGTYWETYGAESAHVGLDAQIRGRNLKKRTSSAIFG